MTPKLKPIEGKIVLKFLDEETDEERDRRVAARSPMTDDERRKGIFAQVMAVGPKSKVKEGSVVLVQPWARDGLDVGDDQVLTDDWCVMATVVTG